MLSTSERPLEKVWHLLRRPRDIWPLFRSYLGIGRRRRQLPIADAAALADFLAQRSSFVAQTSLYGYLRTRAGQRFPVLFDDPGFARSLNLAKWQIWLACLGDLSVFAGGLLARERPENAGRVGPFMSAVVEGILARTGIPADAGPDFAEARDALRHRLSACDWRAIPDDASVFRESPPAVIRWAPIVDHLKALDEPIVVNSVRFRWHEIRRDLRASLQHDALAIAIRGELPPS